MKVLYFHQHFSTPKGATGNRSYQFARKLLETGHTVTMVCGSYAGGDTGLDGDYYGGARRGEVDGIDVIEFHLPLANADGLLRRTWIFLAYAVRCVWVALRQDYDLVFATTTPLTAGIPGIVARWVRGKPFVFEVRDLWPELPKAMGVITNPLVLAMMSALEFASYRSAHRVIGLSPGIVKGIMRRGVSFENVVMIPNGCDLDIFGGSIPVWRPDGVRPDDFMAVFSGTHGQANGLDSLIDGAIELQRRGRSDIKIVLIGNGKMKPGLVARAEEHGLKNFVFHEPVEKAKLSGLLATADMGLQILANVPAFYYGTSPNKFFDYISAGLPVLNNYPGWIADMINDNRIGYVVEPGDPMDFADKLECAAGDLDERKLMGVRARALAARDFDRDDLADKFTRWLEGARSP